MHLLLPQGLNQRALAVYRSSRTRWVVRKPPRIACAPCRRAAQGKLAPKIGERIEGPGGGRKLETAAVAAVAATCPNGREDLRAAAGAVEMRRGECRIAAATEPFSLMPRCGEAAHCRAVHDVHVQEEEEEEEDEDETPAPLQSGPASPSSGSSSVPVQKDKKDFRSGSS